MEAYVNGNDDITLTLPIGNHTPVTYKVFDGLVEAQSGTADVLVSSNDARVKFGFRLNADLETMDHKIRVVWTYVGGTKSEYVNVVTPYATIDEFTDMYAEYGPGGVKEKSIEKLREAERAARNIINAYTGQSFGRWRDTIQVVGSGSEVISLGAPILKIDRMVSGSDFAGQDLMANGYATFEGNSLLWMPKNSYDYVKTSSYSTNGIIYAPPANGRKFDSRTAYTIKGEFGWESVPQEINWCALRMMNDYFCKESVWRKRGVTQIKTADRQFTFDSMMLSSTGDVDVDRVLAQFQTSRISVI